MRYAFIIFRNIALLLVMLLVAEVGASIFYAIIPFSPFAGVLGVLLQVLLVFYFLVKTGEELYRAK